MWASAAILRQTGSQTLVSSALQQMVVEGCNSPTFAFDQVMLRQTTAVKGVGASGTGELNGPQQLVRYSCTRNRLLAVWTETEPLCRSDSAWVAGYWGFGGVPLLASEAVPHEHDLLLGAANVGEVVQHLQTRLPCVNTGLNGRIVHPPV